jgi:DNA-binding CsgD family transcriptional regulator
MRISTSEASILMTVAAALADCRGEHPLERADIARPLERLIGVDFIGTALWDARNETYYDAHAHGRDHAMDLAYEKYYQFLDPIGARQRPVGVGCWHIYQAVPHIELKRSEYFNDFLKRFGTTEGINASLFEGTRYLTDIRFWRGPSHALLGSRERALVELLRPHFEPAIRSYFHKTDAAAMQPSPPIVLTAREADVARLICTGMSDKEAARVMGVSPWTVRTHMRHMFQKTDTRSRTQLAAKLIAGRRQSDR